MGNLLRSKEYWNLVEMTFTIPAIGTMLTDAQQKSLDESKLKDLKVKNYMFQAIDRTILETIMQMKKEYQGNERVKRSILQH